jgi:predicted oxidoreductase
MSIIPLQNYIPNISRIAYGCMELGGNRTTTPPKQTYFHEAERIVNTSLEAGINFFDHADIYTRGKAEQVFGKVLSNNPSLRSQMYLQSKAGIRLPEKGRGFAYYDFSRQWLRQQVEQSLKNLNTDHLDFWMLHRPDPLMEPEVIAELFYELYVSGKVLYFGVSNMHLHQMQFLQAYLSAPMIVNQLELSLGHLHWLDEGVQMNTYKGTQTNFTPGTLEHCRRFGIQVQAQGSLAQGKYSGKPLQNASRPVKKTARLVHELAEKYHTSKEGIVLGWLMRHPAGIQPIISTRNEERIRVCAKATEVQLNREDWYALYVSARGADLP